jgi:FRG domain
MFCTWRAAVSRRLSKALYLFFNHFQARKKLNEIRVPNAEYLLCQLPRQLACGHFYWRGVKSAMYPLVPSIGRQASLLKVDVNTRATRERSMLEDFKARSRALVECAPENDWEWLALAQHHRLPTRLLDWSSSQLTALYFACEKEVKHDGTFAEYQDDTCGLYLCHSKELIPARDVCSDPLQCAQKGIVATAQVTVRMTGQSGLFSIQEDPYVPFDQQFENASEQKWITKFVIPAFVREDVFKILHRLGIRPASIYPDLDGLSNEIRQKQEFGCSTVQPVTPPPPSV